MRSQVGACRLVGGEGLHVTALGGDGDGLGGVDRAGGVQNGNSVHSVLLVVLTDWLIALWQL